MIHVTDSDGLVWLYWPWEWVQIARGLDGEGLYGRERVRASAILRRGRYLRAGRCWRRIHAVHQVPAPFGWRYSDYIIPAVHLAPADSFLSGRRP